MTETELEQKLRATLTAVANSYDLPFDAPADAPKTFPRGRFRSLALVTAAALLVAGLGAAFLARTDGLADDDVDVGGNPATRTTSTPETSTTPAQVANGAGSWTWTTGAQGPIDTSWQQFSIWADSEMFVWSRTAEGLDADIVGAALRPGH